MKKKKSNKLIIVLVIVLILILLALVGYIAYDKLNTSNYNNSKDTVVEKEQDTYLELDMNIEDKIINFIFATSPYTLTGKDVTENFESKLSDKQKMNVALYTLYGKIAGSSVCEANGTDEELVESDIPNIFNDTSYIENYKNNQYQNNTPNLTFNDYQDTDTLNNLLGESAYILKYKDNTFYIRDRFCGSEGINSTQYIKFISGKENDKEIVVELQYIYAYPSDFTDTTVTFDTYDNYDIKNSHKVESITINSSKNVFDNIDYSKYKTYTITFNKTDKGFIFDNTKVTD